MPISWNGFADEPEAVATNTNLCIAQGVAGLSIEDNTGNSAAPLYEEKLAVERIRAARRAIDDSGIPVVLTGRCEAWLVGGTDPLGVVLERLTSYAEAGADCLYAPGVREPNEIEQIVKAVAPKPVNVLVSGFNCELTVSQLADLGVRRISVGSGLALAAWGAFIRAARGFRKTVPSIFLAQNAAPDRERAKLEENRKLRNFAIGAHRRNSMYRRAGTSRLPHLNVFDRPENLSYNALYGFTAV